MASSYSSAIGSFSIGFSPIGIVPSQPTPSTLNTIPSYLYAEYQDDDNLQAFVRAYNTVTQGYIEWLNGLYLPCYPANDNIRGLLLNWIGVGLYDIDRPVLGSGNFAVKGPYNTGEFDSLAYNQRIIISAIDYAAVNDDVYKRIITWHFLKGDGKAFTITWLKRRIMRFLTGLWGTNPNIDETYLISVTFGVNGQVNIRLLTHETKVTGGAIFNAFAFNSQPYGAFQVTVRRIANQFPLANIFKEAIQQGALELPFQNTWNVQVQP